VIRRIQGGTFDDEGHSYFDEMGSWVPSCTQVLSLAKYSNFDGIDPAVVKYAGLRGSAVHYLTEVYDEEGFIPPPWTPDEQKFRFDGYAEWKERERFVPDKIEYPMIASVYGMAYGVTLDRTGTLAGQKAIVELKFTAAPSKSWGPQTASQEIALTGKPTLGTYLRAVCHVNAKGKAKTILHRDSADAQRFIFALGSVWTRIDFGQDVRKEILEDEE
jgi:hypothetical protein